MLHDRNSGSTKIEKFRMAREEERFPRTLQYVHHPAMPNAKMQKNYQREFVKFNSKS